MAQQFCTQCGERRNNPQQRFCTKCGAPFADSAQVVGAEQPVQPIVQSDVTSKMPVQSQAPVPPTAGMQHQVPVSPAGGMQPQAPLPPQKQRANTSMIIAIIAAVLIVLVAVLLVLFHPWDGGSSQASSTTTPSSDVSSTQASSSSMSSSTSSSTTSSSAGSSSSSSDASEEKLYETLVSAYDSMAGYDDRIRNAANDFNNTYTSSDSSLRRANSATAHELRTEISADLDKLRSQAATSSSKYYRDYQNMVQLMQDLYNRIDVICQAWDNALSYSNPKDHTDAILAPISRDNESDGVNKYKRDFDTLYPTARPTK